MELQQDATFMPMDGKALHLNTCTACGALVTDGDIGVHANWHTGLLAALLTHPPMFATGGNGDAPEMRTPRPAEGADVPPPLTLSELREKQRRAENTKPGQGVRLGTRVCGTPCYTYTGVLMGSCALLLGHPGPHSVHAAEMAMVPDEEAARRRGKR
jgi:hypothetical protein